MGNAGWMNCTFGEVSIQFEAESARYNGLRKMF